MHGTHGIYGKEGNDRLVRLDTLDRLLLVETTEIWFNTSYISFPQLADDSLFMAVKQRTLSRRVTALLGLIAVAIVIGTLIYLEQIAILYVLATLALVALLLVVAFADLESVGREDIDGFVLKNRKSAECSDSRNRYRSYFCFWRQSHPCLLIRFRWRGTKA